MFELDCCESFATFLDNLNHFLPCFARAVDKVFGVFTHSMRVPNHCLILLHFAFMNTLLPILYTQGTETAYSRDKSIDVVVASAEPIGID